MEFRVNNKINWTLILSWSFLFAFAVYIAVNLYNTDKKWSNPQFKKKYSIAIVTDYINRVRTAPWYVYEFKVNGEVYESRHLTGSEINKLSYEKRKKFIGHKWIVKYIEDDPSYSELLMKYYVADSIKPPPSGWNKVPEYIKD